MNAKSLLAGTVAGTVVLFLVAYLVYGLALEGFYDANMDIPGTKAEPDMLLMTLSMIVFAAMLTYVFTAWANVKSVRAGATAGAILGLLFYLSFDLGFAAMHDGIASIVMIVDPLAGAVVTACGGAAIGFVLSKMD